MADPFLTPAEIRERMVDLVNPARFPDDTLAELVEEFEGKAERYVGYALTVREATFSPVDYCTNVILPHLRVLSATVTAGGDPVDVTRLDGGSGLLCIPAGVDVVVSYTHGTDPTPAAAKRACALYVWREAIAQANPNTGNSYLTTNAELGIVERQSTADPANGRPTGWLDVDRILNGLDRTVLPGIG